MKSNEMRKRGGRMLRTLLLAFLAFVVSGAVAQNVTISPKTGNVISAVSTQGENHMAGYGGAWIHNQIPLNIFTSDDPDLTDGGLPSTHANNIKPTDNGFVWVGGTTHDGYFTISLPKGYRFTGYKMVMTNNVTKADFNPQNGSGSGYYPQDAFGSGDYTMTEKSGSFSGTTLATVNLGSHSTSNTKEYTLQRTSSATNKMGNILYFQLGRQSGYVAVYVKSLEISFECDESFTQTIRPAATMTTGADCVALAAGTGRMDLGQITQEKNNGYTSMKYTYTNVKDLQANFMLYDNDGISNGTASTSAKKDGHITAASVNGGLHYALQNDTYYIETPTDAITQNNATIPVGYRITGAKLHYYGTADKTVSKGSDFYITDGNGKYMDSSLNFTDKPVVWHSDSDGRIYTESGSNTVYLTHEKNVLGVSTKTLKTTTKQKDAREYTTIDNAGVTYKAKTKSTFGGGEYETWYLSVSDGKGSYAGTKATILNIHYNDSYTLNLYGTDGNTVAQTVTVDGDNTSGTLEVTGLNNDALKFEVEDLQGSAAYVYAELTLEALNPYVSKMDVVAKVQGGEETLSQSYLADDFTIGEGGNVNFSVPDNFASSGVQILFDNLTSKKADNTYGPMATDGNSRYHFVKSAYYDAIGENLQEHRNEAASYDYQKKVRVEVAGDKQFKVNNSDEFKAGTTGGSSTNYMEYRYTNSEYQTQGGKWDTVSLTRDANNALRYLVTCDETRYNLAPTTTPRHAFYAYYSVNVTLEIADYEPKLTYTKVYDNAMLASGYDKNAYYGVKVNAKMKDGGETVAAGKGYLFAKQILDQISADAGKDNCPSDAKHILYMDASELNTVLSSSTNAETYGKIESIQDALGANAMIYLPAGITYTLKNVASKTVSGDYKAENNIVLTDKQPFFAPYDIRVDANNYTEYTRQVTHDYGRTTWLTLVLPFTLDISETNEGTGTHTNREGGSSFQLYTMQLTNAISGETGNNYDYEVTGHFTPATGSSSLANKPYLVKVLANETEADENTIFVVRQNGANIKATPTGTDGLGTLVDGETATGKLGSDNVTFTQHGAFNGVKLAENSGTYFYFAKSRFVSSANLTNDKNVYVMPFRTYYDYKGTSNAKYMNISIEPNDATTGIGDTAAAAAGDISLTSTTGTLTITAHHDAKVSVRNLSGQTVASLSMAAGTSHSVVVPSGMYIVNGVKVIVR